MKFFAGAGELAATAVNDDEVWKSGAGVGAADGLFGGGLVEGGLFRVCGGGFLEDSAVSAADDFGHAGEVILAWSGSDAEASVAGSVGLAVFEADHTGDDVGVADVGDVEAFHDDGWCREAKGVGECGEVGGGINAGGQAFACEACDGFCGGFEVGEEVSELGRFLEVEALGGGVHFRFDLGDHVAGGAFEELAGLLDTLEVMLTGDASDAGCGAIFDDMVEAVFVIAFAGVEWAA